MAMRDLVTGGAACAVPGSSSSSNPIGALANTLVGSSSKTQERLQEIPTSTSVGSNSQYSDSGDRSAALPGLESDYQSNQNLNGQGSTFLHGFRGISQGGLQDSWDEIHRPQMPYHHYQEGQANFVDPRLVPSQGPPQKILSSFLHSFVNSNHGSPFQPATLPALGLTKGDKQCIRDRSSIMARHIFGDKSEEFINAQVDALLSSLDIDNDIRARGPMPSRFRELDEYWNESQRAITPVPPAANGWVTEFSQQHRDHMGPDAWAHQFEQQHGPSGWASEFSLEQSQMSSANQIGSAPFSNVAVMEQSRMIANTLAQDNNPKFQNSKFLNFVSKMSRGELFVDNNQLRSAPVGNDWATEYESYNPSVSGAGPSMYNEAAYVPDKWADEFASGSKQHGKNVFQDPFVPFVWADEFAGGSEQHGSANDQWVNEFSKLHVQDWADEFGRQVGEGALSDDVSDSWANAYDEYINEQVAAKQHSNSSRGIYEFSDVNPYVGHPDPLKEGQELFKKGLLSEAVLALEAEVLKNPENAEGWRLLGIAHAENDDDQQAISSLMRAQEVDPTNLEILLALGVSHTNELEQRAALRYLYQWLRHHPKYGTLAPPELSDSLYHADIARVFSEAAQMSPEDADVHIVLGVLYNLSRDYDRAVESFKTALKLKPNDYSLWNKLAATQANSMQSADAVFAYQEALDLKPNYVRAWTNMGISYANQGMYEESVRYYVRALSMNPKADNAWNYLRISLSCDARSDMLEACDSRNLDLLQKEFPL